MPAKPDSKFSLCRGAQAPAEAPRAVERRNLLQKKVEKPEGTLQETPSQALTASTAASSQPGAFPVAGNRRPSIGNESISSHDPEYGAVVKAHLVDDTVERERDDLRRRLDEVEESMDMAVVGEISKGETNNKRHCILYGMCGLIVIAVSILASVFSQTRMPNDEIREYEGSLVFTRPLTPAEHESMKTTDKHRYCFDEFCNTTTDDENIMDLLEWSDDELLRRGLSGLRIGEHCEIIYSVTTACSYYVLGRPSEIDPIYFGIPLNKDRKGTGCVAADPFCWYRGSEYDFLTEEEIDSFCTGSQESNAAAMLRYGIRNGYCTGSTDHFREYFPQCGNLNRDDTPDVYCDEENPYCVTRFKTKPPIRARGEFCTDCPVGNACSLQMLRLPHSDVLELASSGKSIGDYCQVVESDECESGLAVKSRGDLFSVVPRNETQGFGCVFEPDINSNQTSADCPYRLPVYNVTKEESAAMCNGNVTANAAGQLRVALWRGLCTDECKTIPCDL